MQSHWNHLSDIVVYGTCKSLSPLYTSDYLLNRPTACNIFFLFVLVLCALSTKNCLFPVLTHLVRLNKQYKQKWNWKYHCDWSRDQSNRYSMLFILIQFAFQISNWNGLKDIFSIKICYRNYTSGKFLQPESFYTISSGNILDISIFGNFIDFRLF